MKTFPFIAALACGLACIVTSISAQNLDQALEASFPVSLGRKAEGNIREERQAYTLQNSNTLESRETKPVERESVVDLDILRQPSPYGKVDRRLTSTGSEETLRQNLALLSATYREIAKPGVSGDCVDIALSVKQRIKLDPPAALESVEQEIATNPACACEIVKAAIQTAGDDPSLVTNIVETAITAAPEHMRLISQCAIAAAPESLVAIQTLLAKFDPNGSDSSFGSKSAKSAKYAVDAITMKPPEKTQPNPLDLPSIHIIEPPPIMPPVVTNVNP